MYRGDKEDHLGEVVSQWTVTRQVYTESLTSRHSGISNDVLLFCDIGLSLVHHYRVHKRGWVFCTSRFVGITCRSSALYYRCLRSCRSREVARRCLLDSAMCGGISWTLCVLRLDRPTHDRPIRIMESPVRNDPLLMV